MANDVEKALYWKERTLRLIMALDTVRDSFEVDSERPYRMFDRMVTLLKDQLQADACAMALLEETSDEIEYVAADGFTPEEAARLGRMAADHPGTGPVAAPGWAHTLGIQVVLRQYPLAGIVLARQGTPFSIEEVGLLNVAESQVDSAVLQARVMTKLTQRNRELEAIYQIDRLRDTTTREGELISGLTAIALRHFDADFCLVAVGATADGNLIVRGASAARGVSREALDAICRAAAEIDVPQVIVTPDEMDDTVLLAAPFLVAGARYGAVVVGREAEFTISDHRLLYAIMSQMDTAIAGLRAHRR